MLHLQDKEVDEKMAPKIKVTKDEIVDIAVELVRGGGNSALNARDIASRLGCSTQPIFSNFESMEKLRREVISAAEGIYRKYINEEMESGQFPAYKASGMAYIRFAGEEGELFRLLFMRRRTPKEISEDHSELTNMMIDMIRAATALDASEASLLHLEMWTFVHGIAVMIATGYFKPERELASRMLTDAYQGLKSRLEGV